MMTMSSSMTFLLLSFSCSATTTTFFSLSSVGSCLRTSSGSSRGDNDESSIEMEGQNRPIITLQFNFHFFLVVVFFLVVLVRTIVVVVQHLLLLLLHLYR